MLCEFVFHRAARQFTSAIRKRLSAGALWLNQTTQSQLVANQSGTTPQRAQIFASRFCTESPWRKHWNLKSRTLARLARQIVPGHFFRLRHAENKKGSARYPPERRSGSELRRIVGNINEVHKVTGVRGVRRAVRVAHLLAVAVVARHQRFPVEF